VVRCGTNLVRLLLRRIKVILRKIRLLRRL